MLHRAIWIPNVLIVNVKTFKTMSGLKDETGLFILDDGEEDSDLDILYVQLAEITFLCPMRCCMPFPYRKFTFNNQQMVYRRFDLYPLDSHLCSLLVHSAFDVTSIVYNPMKLNFNDDKRTIILEYAINIKPIEGPIFFEMAAGLGGNYSVAGLEMSFTRQEIEANNHKVKVSKLLGTFFTETNLSTLPCTTCRRVSL